MVSMGSVYSWSLPIWVLRIDEQQSASAQSCILTLHLCTGLTVTEIWLESWMSLDVVEHLRCGLTV